MNIDLLIKMANEISAYFASEPDTEQAVKNVAGHLKRYWEPRMRRQIITYCEERQGAGLSDLAQRGVGLLAAMDSPPRATASP
ncbi:MAG TPA: formate dehydrogenase subunit delta [Steroidobacteraceae bacterium]|jgi:formate dehydrogenase subunit delta|nr:formate dehydrogenase subunit delta [Steroidobacteraceae bacterium]